MTDWDRVLKTPKLPVGVKPNSELPDNLVESSCDGVPADFLADGEPYIEHEWSKKFATVPIPHPDVLLPPPPGISEESKRRHMNSDEDTIQYLTEVCCMSKCAALNLIADVIEGKVPGIGWNGK